MQKSAYKIVVFTIVVLAIAGVVALKAATRGERTEVAATAMPAIREYGLGTCEQCKRMKPILDALKTEYDGRAIVEIVDLGDHPADGDKYGIRVMPTQIFFDAAGNEVGRHEGFYPREELIARLEGMGVE